MSAKQVFIYVKENVEAYYPRRGAVASLLISELSSRGKKGMYVFEESDLPFSNNGLGNYNNVSSSKDSDGDGIPDKWKNRLGLDANNPSEA